MSQQLGQAQQQAQASLEALQERIQNELDRKYSSALMMPCSLSVPQHHTSHKVLEALK